jgi:hypothetical protein
VTLTDSATLANGYHPTGTITFTLVAPSGGTAATPTTKAPTTRVVRPSSP